MWWKRSPWVRPFRRASCMTSAPGMRTFRPVIDTEKCVKCLRCFLVCPDGAIDKSGEHLEIDYDYCKGCGVCNRACKLGAITMVKETEV